ncbi:SprT family zinc-dependent metalloprotease [Nodularia sp. UHCC 0506]|uniref:M48 family metallopeptidase n=1 Tax=Nodularia sp. UHCC 0506 TaxID=3110243 RepID=UPI002B1F56A8|nr:SprT family zinc-dependent metalloprotease [Nodularia sp. UHCC 0506]MEA5517253.1 SprT family zinc-dependent metalloprotease [Nodularia sp. UHCC 0506]
MKTYQITVGELIIDVARKNIKNLHLAVYPPDGRVRIATPLHIDDDAVRLFAISKLGWIKKHQANFASQQRQTTREFVSGETHYFQGKNYLLNVIYSPGYPKVEIRDNTHINLYVKPESNAAQRQQVIISWYRQQLKEQIPPLIAKWEPNMGVKVEDWGVKLMRTKWGTCNIQAKRIWLNLELAKKDPQCLEYVVVHEMVHLLERYHGDRFVSLMNKFLPNWKFYKDELNRSPLGSY